MLLVVWNMGDHNFTFLAYLFWGRGGKKGMDVEDGGDNLDDQNDFKREGG